MDFLIFTFPNCDKCEKMKNHLRNRGVEYQEFNLTRKESKIKIQEFLDIIKRDKTGAIILPTLIIQENGKVQKVVNSVEDLESWWASKE